MLNLDRLQVKLMFRYKDLPKLSQNNPKFSFLLTAQHGWIQG
jgi:hypothetical protein